MELTKKAIAQVRFRTKGKWYDARQVDLFLEELTVAVDQQERSLQEVKADLREAAGQMDKLRRENYSLREKAEQRLRQGEEQEQKLLEGEKDKLIEDIKTLRWFRETFRKAVAQDAKALLEQAEALGSDKLL